jgi:hypothetical protein
MFFPAGSLLESSPSTFVKKREIEKPVIFADLKGNPAGFIGLALSIYFIQETQFRNLLISLFTHFLNKILSKISITPNANFCQAPKDLMRTHPIIAITATKWELYTDLLQRFLS